jgi:two-component system, OmpR family, response regulator
VAFSEGLASRGTAGARPCSILCVDDDRDIGVIVEAALALAGYRVHIARSGSEAMSLLMGATQIDLVLMDVMMPGLDGPATLQLFGQHPRTAHLPVIFLTAKVMPAEVAQLLLLGAIGVLRKPFDPLKLSAKIDSLWSGRSAAPPVTSSVAARPVQVAVQELLTPFLEHARTDVRRLQKLLPKLRLSSTVLPTIEDLAHALHGTGAVFGLSALSIAAGRIEHLAVAAREQQTSAVHPLNPRLLTEMQIALQDLVLAVAVTGGRKPRSAGPLTR